MSKGLGRPARPIRGRLHGHCAGGQRPLLATGEISSLSERLPHLSSRLSDQRVQVALRSDTDVASRLVGAGLRGPLIVTNQWILGESRGKAVDELREDALPLAKAPVGLVEVCLHDHVLWSAGDLEKGFLKAPNRPAQVVPAPARRLRREARGEAFPSPGAPQDAPQALQRPLQNGPSLLPGLDLLTSYGLPRLRNPARTARRLDIPTSAVKVLGTTGLGILAVGVAWTLWVYLGKLAALKRVWQPLLLGFSLGAALDHFALRRRAKGFTRSSTRRPTQSPRCFWDTKLIASSPPALREGSFSTEEGLGEPSPIGSLRWLRISGRRSR